MKENIIKVTICPKNKFIIKFIIYINKFIFNNMNQFIYNI